MSLQHGVSNHRLQPSSLGTFYPLRFQDSELFWVTASQKKKKISLFLELWKHKHSSQKFLNPLLFSWHPLTLTGLMCLLFISSWGYRGPEESFGSIKTTNQPQGNWKRSTLSIDIPKNKNKQKIIKVTKILASQYKKTI